MNDRTNSMPRRLFQRRRPTNPNALYVVVRTVIQTNDTGQVVTSQTWPTEPTTRELADREFGVAVAVGSYGPHSGRRIRVMEIAEYERTHGPAAGRQPAASPAGRQAARAQLAPRHDRDETPTGGPLPAGAGGYAVTGRAARA